MLLFFAAAAVVAVLLWMLMKTDPEPLYGVYAQPGKWTLFKKCIFYLMFKLREYRNKGEGAKTRDSKGQGGSGYGVKSRKDPWQMECPQELCPGEEHALDAAYINGVNKEGVCFILRIGRRHNREAELWLSIKLPGAGFYQSPIHPDTTVYNTDGKGFNVGGLKFECQEPHKKWKVNFNGVLQEGLCNTWSGNKGKLVHVKFSFLWEAFSDVFDFDTDLDPWLISEAIAREKWTREFWNNLRGKHQTHYEQWGELRGVLNIEGKDEMKLYMRSCRDHSYGVRDWRSFHRYIVHFGCLEDGSTFHVSVVSLPVTTSYLQCGYLNRPNSEQHAVTSVDLDMPHLGEHGNPPESYSFNFTAGEKKYNMQVKGHTTPIYHHGQDWGNIIYEIMCDFTVNGKAGWGVTEFCYKRPEGDCPVPRQQSVPLLQEPDPKGIPLEDKTALALTFQQPSCCSSHLVGGKGCQLAMLMQMLTQEKDRASFSVPPGFCLTLAAFSKHLQVNDSLNKQLIDLASVACGKKSGSLKDACDQMVSTFLESSLCPELEDCIWENLQQIFPDEWQQLSFAVRSSAAGEDGKELSAAGQMETILAVKGLQQVFEAVVRCWSSHFAYTAVEYRRQHGQPILASMGVIIQKMVPAEAAGVLFTRDPLTGNPQYMTLNANYGLGESVVSGRSQPDLITVSRNLNNDVEIKKTEIGSKKIQITPTEGGGTEELEVSSEDIKKCCISDDIILRLACTGIQLEKSFSDPRDIEWAVVQRQIYLLQARPITTLDQETDWELLHEFDTPLCTDKEMLGRYNFGEVMPGSITPLGLTSIYSGLEQSVQQSMIEIGLTSHLRNYHKFLAFCCNQGFINMSFMHGMYEGTVLGNSKEMAELAICGEPIKDFTLEDVIEYNDTLPFHRRLWNACLFWKNILQVNKRRERWEERMKTYTLLPEHCTAQEVYDTLAARAPDYVECVLHHTFQSSASTACTSVIMAIITKGALKWEPQHYADVALLLSRCENVHSADVPASLQRLAGVIRRTGMAEKFVDMEPGDALQWLKSSESGEASQQFTDFMKEHGHRCVREFEVHEKSWQSEPSKIIKSLQAILRAPEAHSSSNTGIEDVNEAIAQLKTPTSIVSRQILKFLLPIARRAVGARERSKNTAVKLVDCFKEGYWRLAELMLQEGRLPDADLLFYLTQIEIGRLLKTWSGQLVARAQRRRRIAAQQGSFDFPLVQRGHPQPITEDEDEDFITSLKVTGMPVSQGTVKGTARIVKSLDNAHTIQAEDILVVKTTDVGWSPYFPIISGLVTEMGGLISHGAVVAREYGIPCLVNVKRATSLFKSGDQVLLNATAGTLEKLEEST